MFDNLTERLTQSLQHITGNAKLSDYNIQGTLREVRMALLEADVALPVVKTFIEKVKDAALGENVNESLDPGQMFTKIVNKVLIDIMGTTHQELDFSCQPPAIILVAGLQGAGKTTFVAKLGRWLKTRQKKSVMVASADIYRPAAIRQLEVLAGEAGIDFFPSLVSDKPTDIVSNAIDAAKLGNNDVLLLDTAGRLHVDDKMMEEVVELHRLANPIETLFVVDAMTGQDSANTARVFNERLALTGVVLTKLDGDARGGAALSVREITGKPIKFVSVGEKLDALEPFHPERIASRILGMGDVLSLIEEVEQKVDKKKADKLLKKLKKRKGFNLEDFKDQIDQMKNMGGVAGLMDKLPSIPGMSQSLGGQLPEMGEKMFKQMDALISSMTPHERKNPDVINGSRKKRIARGSGSTIQDVNKLLKQHKQMSKTMKKLSGKGGMMKMMRGISGMKGKIPSELLSQIPKSKSPVN